MMYLFVPVINQVYSMALWIIEECMNFRFFGPIAHVARIHEVENLYFL